ncbi:uncharacterized protein IL334_001729 [Kwoniella shivajii]|uniref:Major facilitator superfamily (MFS) profile domain-containing protein n=1 Tax=Kwoniella shivajii TaxID=564305 RepID=A0ABZ1CSR1_9TREE|nr:hypothetical protein IL334_001729 [Kwoniella shivajii]
MAPSRGSESTISFSGLETSRTLNESSVVDFRSSEDEINENEKSVVTIRKTSTLTNPIIIADPTLKELPSGCTYGPIIDSTFRDTSNLELEDELFGSSNNNGNGEDIYIIIWVDLPIGSPINPLNFSTKRKYGIMTVATLFTCLTAVNVGAFSIGLGSMMKDLKITRFQASLGNGLYNLGFAITPLVLAPLSEEFGRRWTYAIAVIIYLLMHIMLALAKDLGTMIAARVLQGCSGSVAATLVGGTISDIYIPADRGLPTAMFAFTAMAGSGFGPLMFCWVESNPKLEWRWMWWIQSMMITILIIPIFLILRETREPVILRRQAKKLRKERGLSDVGRYTARSEIGKISFWVMMRSNCLRAITFLVVEPILLFFSTWMGLAWGVLYAMVTGLSYVFTGTYGFSINQVGLIYITIIIGATIGFFSNFLQDATYRRKVEKVGIEARLYSPMVGGLGLAIGCFWFGLSSQPNIHWIMPSIGIVIIMASIFPIYLSGFVYISECYGSYASSALAAQSFLRNVVAAAFVFFILDMYDALTPRWTSVTWGSVALLLSTVPFIAFKFGPKIRSKSKYSKILMKEEQERLLREKQVPNELG